MLTNIKEFFSSRWEKTKVFISKEKNLKFTVPMVAIFLGFMFGIIVMLITGVNPLDFFTGLFEQVTGINLNKIGTGKTVFNPRHIGEFFVYSMPVILTGLSVAFAFRTGLFNIGAEGQLLMGSLGAVIIGVVFELPTIIHLPLAVITGVLFGAAWGFVPGILKAKFNVHEVVVTIMMNYLALYTANYFIKALPGSDNIKTVEVHETASLASQFFYDLTNKSRFHWGFILVIVAVFIFWLIIDKTTFGFELRSAGLNKHASKYAGMKVDRNIMLSMVISGAFAGLAGVIIAIGTFQYGRVLVVAEGYGFDGIAVALVGGTAAVGSLLAGLLFGALKAAQPLMQLRGIPKDIANIIMASIVFFVAMQNAIKRFLIRFRKREEE